MRHQEYISSNVLHDYCIHASFFLLAWIRYNQYHTVKTLDKTHTQHLRLTLSLWRVAKLSMQINLHNMTNTTLIGPIITSMCSRYRKDWKE